MIDSITNGENKVVLCSKNDEELGQAILKIKVKQAPCKKIILENISISVSE